MLITILAAALAANACRFGPGGLTNPPPATAAVTASPALASPAVSATLPGRTAVLNDLVGNVLSGPAGSGKDTPASNGQTIIAGTSVHTGKASKATVNLNDGTILRLRADTLVTLDQLVGDAVNPFTRVLLALGKVFVILKSGQLEVQSPVGTATVTGSFLSVEFQPDTNTVVVTCLEGNCTLRNDQGGTRLTTGQAASLTGGGSAVLRWMTPAEIQAWLDDNPEAQAVAPAALAAIPTATGTVTATPTASSTATPSSTPSSTATPSATRLPPKATPSASASATRRPRPTSTDTPLPTPSPTLTKPTPTPIPPTPPPTPVPAQNPLNYSFDSICVSGQPDSPGTYHVTIDGPASVNFDVPPNQPAVTGQLPPGLYTIGWTPDNGPHQEFTYLSDQGPYDMTFCGKP